MRSGDICGMETATSMLLLIISAGMIFGMLSFLEKGEGNDASLADLRSYQVSVLGSSVITCYQFADEDLDISKGIIMVYDGSLVQTYSGPPERNLADLSKVMAATPDGLTSILIVHPEKKSVDPPRGEFMSWSYKDGNGVCFLLHLSMHIGSLDTGGLLD